MFGLFKRKAGAGKATATGTGGKDELAALNEEELGGRIATIWEGCIRDIVSLLGGMPAVDQAIKDRVQEMKQAAIETLVALGKARAPRDTSKRAYVDLIFTNRMGRFDPGTFKAFGDIVNHYRKVDKDLATEISSFNIITQYTNFELLRKQAPAEADRLGLP